MKEYWQKAQTRWSGLALREQRLLMLGAIFLTIFFIYQFIWVAFNDHIVVMRRQIKTQQETLRWMQSADRTMQQIEGHAEQHTSAHSPVLLMSYLQQQLKQSELESPLTELKQNASDAVEMHLQQVAFDKLVSLLIRISKEQPVTISQLSITPENTPGMVTAVVVMKL